MKVFLITLAALLLPGTQALAAAQAAVTVSPAGSQPTTIGAPESFTGTAKVDSRFKAPPQPEFPAVPSHSKPEHEQHGTRIPLDRHLLFLLVPAGYRNGRAPLSKSKPVMSCGSHRVLNTGMAHPQKSQWCILLFQNHWTVTL